MKFKVFTSVLVLMLVFCASSYAQDDMIGIHVVDMKFCTGISNRAPVGVSDKFSNSLKKIYCYTDISGADAPATISHVWYYGDEKKAEIFLDVRSSSFRTWSSKTIMKSWTGEWTVEVVGPSGTVLDKKTFTLGTGPDYELTEY